MSKLLKFLLDLETEEIELSIKETEFAIQVKFRSKRYHRVVPTNKTGYFSFGAQIDKQELDNDELVIYHLTKMFELVKAELCRQHLSRYIAVPKETVLNRPLFRLYKRNFSEDTQKFTQKQDTIFYKGTGQVHLAENGIYAEIMERV